MIWIGCPLAEDSLSPWSGGASSIAQCPGMDLYFSSEMQEIADPVSTRKSVCGGRKETFLRLETSLTMPAKLLFVLLDVMKHSES